jgi:hypothetical protein
MTSSFILHPSDFSILATSYSRLATAPQALSSFWLSKGLMPRGQAAKSFNITFSNYINNQCLTPMTNYINNAFSDPYEKIMSLHKNQKFPQNDIRFPPRESGR